jgi:hypothetical protein
MGELALFWVWRSTLWPRGILTYFHELVSVIV